MDAFSDEYEPRTIVGRENEKQTIADYLKDCCAGRSSEILYIHGLPGIGKTTVARAILNRFEESSNAVVVYLNCRKSSYYKCLAGIYSACFRKESKRLTSSQILTAFTKRVLRKLVLVVALDNFDKMRDLEKFLSDFHEDRKSIVRSGLVLISTSGNKLPELLGNRLYSALRFEELRFKPYSLDELVEIMRSRLEEAFGRAVAEELALFEITSFVRSNSQNVRDAFHILESALEIAQENSLKKVTAEVARTSIEKWLGLNKGVA